MYLKKKPYLVRKFPLRVEFNVFAASLKLAAATPPLLIWLALVRGSASRRFEFPLPAIERPAPPPAAELVAASTPEFIVHKYAILTIKQIAVKDSRPLNGVWKATITALHVVTPLEQ